MSQVCSFEYEVAFIRERFTPQYKIFRHEFEFSRILIRIPDTALESKKFTVVQKWVTF